MTTTKSQDDRFANNVFDYESLLEKAIEWIVDEFNPEDIYPEESMQKWAESNGYVLPEDN